MMDDIPETGAVFTLGKSYLSDNHQSYFFIKNDPVKILISGANQSGVICESGRLFVWGENQCGQLGIGSNEIVTKPSCVKAIKNLGYKIRNAAFGDGFSVILTENNKIYFTGKNIFPENSIINREKFNHQHQIFTRKPFEVFEFDECRRGLDVEQNLEEFVDLSAGHQHFVILSSYGNIFGWGTNQQNQIGPNAIYNQPTQINDNNTKVRVICCGKTSTVFITETNELFIIGLIERTHFVKLQKINTESCFNDLIYSLSVSINDEILLITSDREIYKNKLNGASEIIFEQLDLFINDNENPRKISAGNGFISIVTENNTFITTFNDKLSSATTTTKTTDSQNNIIIVDHSLLNHNPRQLKKFQNLEIIDIVSGLNHILVHAIPFDKNPILSSSEDISVSENLSPYLIRNLQKQSIPTKFNQQSPPTHLNQSQKQLPTFTISDANNNNNNTNLNQENFTQSFDIENEKYFIPTTTTNINKPIELSEDLLNNNNINIDLEKSISLNEFEHLEKEIQQNENHLEENHINIESLTEPDKIENSNELDIKDPILKQLYDNQLNTFSTTSSISSNPTVKSKTEQQLTKLSDRTETDTDTDTSKMNTTINSIVDSVETKTVTAADKISNALTSTFSNNIKQPIQNLMGSASTPTNETTTHGDNLPKSFIDEHIKKPIGLKLDESEVLLKSEIQHIKNTAIKDFHELKTKIGLDNGDDVKKNPIKNGDNKNVVDEIDDESKDEKLKIIINEKNGKQTASLKRTNADGDDVDDDDDDDNDKNSIDNAIDNMVTFIDNGVDVTEHTVKHLVQECDELEHSVKEDVKELKHNVMETGHKIEDSVLGEKLQNIGTDSVRKFKDVKEETKDALKMVVEDVIEPIDIRTMIKTPATLATTAVTVPIHNSMRMNYIEDNTKNPFNNRDDDDMDKISQITTSMHDKKSNGGGGGGGGRVKKFFKELKDFTCQNVNSQATIDDHDPQPRNHQHQQQNTTEYNVNDNDGKVSRYCTIS